MVSGIILGDVLFHVGGENLGFERTSLKNHSDDNRGIPGRGLFFLRISTPWISWTAPVGALIAGREALAQESGTPRANQI